MYKPVPPTRPAVDCSAHPQSYLSVRAEAGGAVILPCCWGKCTRDCKWKLTSCAIVWQLQTWLCLKTGHRPGGQDLLRKLSQVRHREVEVLHSWAINKCGAWLLAEGQRCQGWWGFALSGFFPPSWAYLAAAERHKLMLCSFTGGCTPQQTFRVLLQRYVLKKVLQLRPMFAEMHHVQNVPFLWLKRYNSGCHVTDEGK